MWAFWAGFWAGVTFSQNAYGFIMAAMYARQLEAYSARMVATLQETRNRANYPEKVELQA